MSGCRGIMAGVTSPMRAKTAGSSVCILQLGLTDIQLTRNYNFLGEEAMVKVRTGYVVVVGCGGVGSWCALMLLRRYAHFDDLYCCRRHSLTSTAV